MDPNTPKGENFFLSWPIILRVYAAGYKEFLPRKTISVMENWALHIKVKTEVLTAMLQASPVPFFDGPVESVENKVLVNLRPLYGADTELQILFKAYQAHSNYLGIFFLSLMIALVGGIISIPIPDFLYSTPSLGLTILAIGLIVYFPSLYIAYKSRNHFFPEPTPESFESYLTNIYSSEH